MVLGGWKDTDNPKITGKGIAEPKLAEPEPSDPETSPKPNGKRHKKREYPAAQPQPNKSEPFPYPGDDDWPCDLEDATARSSSQNNEEEKRHDARMAEIAQHSEYERSEEEEEAEKKKVAEFRNLQYAFLWTSQFWSADDRGDQDQNKIDESKTMMDRLTKCGIGSSYGAALDSIRKQDWSSASTSVESVKNGLDEHCRGKSFTVIQSIMGMLSREIEKYRTEMSNNGKEGTESKEEEKEGREGERGKEGNGDHGGNKGEQLQAEIKGYLKQLRK
ncbi:hypothetical protein CLAIMM_10110 [Cladophialophora immunda]|nr:hypothetical protein CLAIMM_10110 [Cladophialophora immunda]